MASANEIIEACGLATGALLDEETKTPSIENGKMQISDISGLGIEMQI